LIEAVRYSYYKREREGDTDTQIRRKVSS
jgi:hypothetical protein